MNDDPMEQVSAQEARAERARQRLADNLRDISSVGGKMLRRTKRMGLGVLIGMGALGLIVLAVSLFRRRRPLKNPLSRYLRSEPSFLKQALSRILLSALGILASRVAQRLPLPAPPPESPADSLTARARGPLPSPEVPSQGRLHRADRSQGRLHRAGRHPAPRRPPDRAWRA